jgi:hypothetical protein
VVDEATQGRGPGFRPSEGRAAVELGNVPRERLYEICKARWTRKPRTEEICQWLLQ